MKSEYEKQRDITVKANEDYLAKLGVSAQLVACASNCQRSKKAGHKEKKKVPASTPSEISKQAIRAPTRRSGRASKPRKIDGQVVVDVEAQEMYARSLLN